MAPQAASYWGDNQRTVDAQVADSDGHEVFFNSLTRETTQDRPKPLQRHWQEAVDRSTGAVYYWNVRTRAVRWERQDVQDVLLDHDEAPWPWLWPWPWPWPSPSP